MKNISTETTTMSSIFHNELAKLRRENKDESAFIEKMLALANAYHIHLNKLKKEAAALNKKCAEFVEVSGSYRKNPFLK